MPNWKWQLNPVNVKIKLTENASICTVVRHGGSWHSTPCSCRSQSVSVDEQESSWHHLLPSQPWWSIDGLHRPTYCNAHRLLLPWKPESAEDLSEMITHPNPCYQHAATRTAWNKKWSDTLIRILARLKSEATLFYDLRHIDKICIKFGTSQSFHS